MSAPPTTWRQRIYALMMIGCVQFVVLTFLAMFLYPGGNQTDPNAKGYHFTKNFFSSLGLTETLSGESNLISFLLFVIALSFAGLLLALFFIAFPKNFNSSKVGFGLSIVGSAFGVLSGLSFIGIALTPANLFLEPHTLFVYLAFVFYLIAVIPYIPAIFIARNYANLYAWIFIGFALLLGSYVWLLFNGPSNETPDGLVIQAVGQKLIVYAAIFCMFFQAYGARKSSRSQIH